jgi:hypothetical protein
MFSEHFPMSLNFENFFGTGKPALYKRKKIFVGTRLALSVDVRNDFNFLRKNEK